MKENEQYLGSDAVCVLEYLRGCPNEFSSDADISRLAEREVGSQEQHNWALPALSRLLALNKVETDGSRRYRLKPVNTTTRKFISPQFQALLSPNTLKINTSHASS
jgi:hypothetical protein